MKVAQVLRKIENSKCMMVYDCYDGSTRIEILDFCGFDENWDELTPEEYNDEEVNEFLEFIEKYCEKFDNEFYPHYFFEDGVISISWASYDI